LPKYLSTRNGTSDKISAGIEKMKIQVLYKKRGHSALRTLAIMAFLLAFLALVLAILAFTLSTLASM
jgi:hypothetical protein